MTTTNPPRFRPVPAIPIVVKGRDAANDPAVDPHAHDMHQVGKVQQLRPEHAAESAEKAPEVF